MQYLYHRLNSRFTEQHWILLLNNRGQLSWAIIFSVWFFNSPALKMAFIFNKNVSKNKSCLGNFWYQNFIPPTQVALKMTLTLLPAPTSIFHFGRDSLEWSLSLLLWKQNMIASHNRQYTVANCGWSCWTWQSEVQKAPKPATTAKRVCTPEKLAHRLFFQHLHFFGSCILFYSARIRCNKLYIVSKLDKN